MSPGASRCHRSCTAGGTTSAGSAATATRTAPSCHSSPRQFPAGGSIAIPRAWRRAFSRCWRPGRPAQASTGVDVPSTHASESAVPAGSSAPSASTSAAAASAPAIISRAPSTAAPGSPSPPHGNGCPRRNRANGGFTFPRTPLNLLRVRYPPETVPMRRPPESPAPQNFARCDGVDAGRFPRRHWPLTLALALGLALVGWAAWELRPGRDPAPPPDGDALRQPASAPSAPSTDPVAIPPAASEGAGIIVGEELDNEPPATVD